jgi:CTD kinase subunit beta
VSPSVVPVELLVRLADRPSADPTPGLHLLSPRRTIATAQLLYHRFHLFFPLKDFPSYHEPILAALYVSSKLHDTLKKPREIVLASYGVRFPDLLGGRVSLSETDVDAAVRPLFERCPFQTARAGQDADGVPRLHLHLQTLEADRLKVLAIERLVLETVCFNFSVQTPFTFVLRFAKALGGESRTMGLHRRRDRIG